MPTASPTEAGLRQPGVLAWLRLARAYHQIDRASAAHLRAWGLSVAQFDVLAQLHGAGGATQQALADRLLVTKGNISQLLDKLEGAGLIERRREGRTKRLWLTPAGADLAAAVVPAQERLIAGLMGALPPHEADGLRRALRRLERALDASAATAATDSEGDTP
jgi:DNA-binding MarR family transcriptional regulator